MAIDVTTLLEVGLRVSPASRVGCPSCDISGYISTRKEPDTDIIRRPLRSIDTPLIAVESSTIRGGRACRDSAATVVVDGRVTVVALQRTQLVGTGNGAVW